MRQDSKDTTCKRERLVKSARPISVPVRNKSTKWEDIVNKDCLFYIESKSYSLQKCRRKLNI